MERRRQEDRDKRGWREEGKRSEERTGVEERRREEERKREGGEGRREERNGGEGTGAMKGRGELRPRQVGSEFLRDGLYITTGPLSPPQGPPTATGGL